MRIDRCQAKQVFSCAAQQGTPGSRLVRAPVDSILAAEAASNYACVLLADGSRPLMRTTMAGLAAQLAGHGFIRVHRSWLVNPDHLRLVEATGGGDCRLTLAGGIQAPLSPGHATAAHAGLQFGRLASGAPQPN